MNRDAYNNFSRPPPPQSRRNWTPYDYYQRNQYQYYDHYDTYDQTPPPWFPRFSQPQFGNMEEIRGARYPFTRQPPTLNGPPPVLPQQLPRRVLALNNGMSRTSPARLFMGLSDFQDSNRSRTPPRMEDETISNQNEQDEALKNLKKEIYNPIPKKLARRLSMYYRDRAMDGNKETDKSRNHREDEDDKRCAVCLEDFVPKEMVMVTPCKHMFHEDCIVPWVKSHGQCPVCRFVICERGQISSTNNNIIEDEVSVAELMSMVRALDDLLIWGHVGI